MIKLLVLLSFLTNVAFAQSEVSGMISEVSELRNKLDSVVTSTPYRADEHQAIKSYFNEIKEFSVLVKSDSRINKRFNTHLTNENLAAVCSDLFISNKDWKLIKVNCTRNRFFLCSEEVNEYSNFKKTVAEALPSEMKDSFNRTLECQ